MVSLQRLLLYASITLTMGCSNRLVVQNNKSQVSEVPAAQAQLATMFVADHIQREFVIPTRVGTFDGTVECRDDRDQPENVVCTSYNNSGQSARFTYRSGQGEITLKEAQLQSRRDHLEFEIQKDASHVIRIKGVSLEQFLNDFAIKTQGQEESVVTIEIPQAGLTFAKLSISHVDHATQRYLAQFPLPILEDPVRTLEKRLQVSKHASRHGGGSVKPVYRPSSYCERRFAQEIENVESWKGLLTQRTCEAFFTKHRFLKGPFNPENVNTSVRSPQVLNQTLQQLTLLHGKLPRNYQQRLMDMPMYIAISMNDIGAVCHNSKAVACYDPKSATIYVLPNSLALEEDTLHELGHDHHLRLPQKKRKWIEGKVREFYRSCNKDHTQKDGWSKWKDGSEGPKHSCLSAYGGKHIDEYLAEYSEHVLLGNIEPLREILVYGNTLGTVVTLEAMRKAGFFGNEDEAEKLLAPIYRGILGVSAREAIKKKQGL